jgi:hypothetical protein
MVLVHSAKIAMAKAIINHRHCHHAGGQRHYQGKDQELGDPIYGISLHSICLAVLHVKSLEGCNPSSPYGSFAYACCAAPGCII